MDVRRGPDALEALAYGAGVALFVGALALAHSPGWALIGASCLGALLWAGLVTHHHLQVDGAGIRRVRSTIGLRWQRVVWPRADVTAIRVTQFDDPGQWFGRAGLGRWTWAPVDPSSWWCVAARASDGRELVLERGIEAASDAQQLAREVADALGAPAVPVEGD